MQLKKLSLFALVITCMATMTNAQKHCDVGISIAAPYNGATIAYGDTVIFTINIKNNGPDTLTTQDSILYANDASPVGSMQSINLLPGDSSSFPVYMFVNNESTSTSVTACSWLVPFDMGYTDNNSMNDSACTTYTLLGQNSSLIDPIDENNKANITLFPNPADNYIKIVVANPSDKIKSVALMNCYGINAVIYKAAHQSDELIINTSALKEGVYFVKINTLHTTINQKLIINHKE